MNVPVVCGEGGWLLLAGAACAAYSPLSGRGTIFLCVVTCSTSPGRVWLLHLFLAFPLITLSFCPASWRVLAHLTFLTPPLQCALKGLSHARPWATSRRVMRATGEVVFLLSAPMSGLWQMGAAVTGEIRLISCNLSPLHAQSHCGAGAVPATYGRMAEGIGRLLQNAFRDLRCRDQKQKLTRCCESAEY